MSHIGKSATSMLEILTITELDESCCSFIELILNSISHAFHIKNFQADVFIVNGLPF